MSQHDPDRIDMLASQDAATAALTEKFTDMWVPGYQVEFDPDEAVLAGAFAEDALSEQDALDSDRAFGETAVSPPLNNVA